MRQNKMGKDDYLLGYNMHIFWETARLTKDDPQYVWAIKNRLCDGFEWRYPLEYWQLEMVDKYRLCLEYAIPAHELFSEMMREQCLDCLFHPEEVQAKNPNESADVLDYANREVYLPAALITRKRIEKEVAWLKELTKKSGEKIWWSADGEWDSSGYGYMRWIDKAYGEKTLVYKTKKEGYKHYLQYLKSITPINEYLKNPEKHTGLNIQCSVGYSLSAHYAMENGYDQVLTERHNDEIGDLQTAVAFTRGASHQYGKLWGIDISKYHRSSCSATKYNKELHRVGGWSPYYTEQHYYITYLSGAHSIKQEQAFLGRANEEGFFGLVKGNNVKSTPMGLIAKKFSDFVHKKYPDRGLPVIPIGLIFGRYHGWSPEGKNGRIVAHEKTWWMVPFTKGDYMMPRLFDFIFPDYDKLESAVDGIPWFDSRKTWEENYRNSAATCVRYNEFVAKGGDTRPYETMGNSPFGDSFNILLNHCPLKVLRKYPVLIVTGNCNLTGNLVSKFSEYVKNGGILVVNERQLGDIRPERLGVNLEKGFKMSEESYLPSEKAHLKEEPFKFRKATLSGARVLAVDKITGYPLIVSYRFGRGEWVLMLSEYSLDCRNISLLKCVKAVLGEYIKKNLPVVVSGEPIEYVVNRCSENSFVLGLFNHSARNWQGMIHSNRYFSNRKKVVTNLITGKTETVADNGVDIQMTNPVGGFEFKILRITLT